MRDREIADSIETLASAVDNVAKALAKKSRASREPAWAKRLEALMGNMGDAVAAIKEASDEHDAELQDVARALTELAARDSVNPADTADLEALTDRLKASTESMRTAVADAEAADPGPAPVPDPVPDPGAQPGDQPPA